jgi:hypothetical protein
MALRFAVFKTSAAKDGGGAIAAFGAAIAIPPPGHIDTPHCI